MKITLIKSAIAVAVATIASSGAVLAQGSATDTTVNHLSLANDITINGPVPDPTARVINYQKVINGSSEQNTDVPHYATVEDDAMKGATGKIGLNAVAGDNNMQDNSSAISVADPDIDLGIVPLIASVKARQTASGNSTVNENVENVSLVRLNAFEGAKGSIGVNVATGNFLLQKNSLAIAVGNSTEARSWVDTNQQVGLNTTTFYNTINKAIIDDVAFMNAGGNIGVNMTAGTNNVQNNSLASSVGNGILAAATAKVTTYQELLDGSTGVTYYGDLNSNSVYLGGDSFETANGNIGVNMAAGANNLQSNGMALSYTPVP